MFFFISFEYFLKSLFCCCCCNFLPHRPDERLLIAPHLQRDVLQFTVLSVSENLLKGRHFIWSIFLKPVSSSQPEVDQVDRVFVRADSRQEVLRLQVTEIIFPA